MKQGLFVIFLALFLHLSAAVPLLKNTAADCDPSKCIAPDCRCSSTQTPGGLSPDEIPHFVVLSFDDGVTVVNHPFYKNLQERTNPNECNIRMTFFVSHENSDYTLVNDLYRNYHEIAVHSVTHKPDVENYWRQMNKAEWAAEMNDQKYMLNKYGKIDMADMKGFRAPFLEVGGDSMYEALQENGFEYDCSWPTLKYTPWYINNNTINGALWPYTLDYESIQEQTVGTKPTETVPGVWVAPITDLLDNRGEACAMLDACQGSEDELDTSPYAVKDLLKRNFNAHFADRTPFGIYVQHAWFLTDKGDSGDEVKQDGFEMFLDYLQAFDWVYVVSLEQLMAWVKDPVPVSEMKNHPAFQCSKSGTLKPVTCTKQINCEYKSEESPLPIDVEHVFMKICDDECPPYYPYLNNVDGETEYVPPETNVN